MDSQELIEAQSCLFDTVQNAMKNLPQLGLYPDEVPTDFGKFVHRLRWKLSRSPATLLLQSANIGFASLPDIEKLMVMLKVTDHSIDVVAQKVEQLSKGKLYNRLTRLQTEAPVEDPEMLRLKINDSLKKKGKSFPAAERVDEIVEKMVQNGSETRKKRPRQIQLLESQLQSDAEFLFYQKVLTIWEKSGAQALWDNYCAVSRMLSERRVLQGKRFEQNTRAACFDLMAAQLSCFAANSDQTNRGNGCELFLESNTFWWHGNEKVGEIDMVLVARRGNEETVLAVCEIKSSCFEIGAAARQHEKKLALVTSQEKRDDCNVKPVMLIGKTLLTARQVDKQARFFVATLASNFLEQHIGAEPIVVGAICNSLRSRGYRISLPSNQHVCEPLVSLLRNEDQREEAVQYLIHLPANHEPVFDARDQLNDLNSLRVFVQDAVGEDQLTESPLNCLRRLQSEGKLILLPSSFTPKGCPSVT